MNKRGFTLLELSIVIVIIGLIVAGVSAGQSLVAQANIRSVIANVESWKTSVTAFELAYGDKPGDIANATSYWPTQSNVLDGNSDGYIGSWNITHDENAAAWRHLSLAELIDENFPGTASGPSLADVRGAVPESSFQGGNSIGNFRGTGSYLFISSDVSINDPFPRTNAIALVKTLKDNISDQGVLEVEIAQNIDNKMDDGLPFTGKVAAYQNHVFSVQRCTDISLHTNPSPKASASYILNGYWCGLYFALNDQIYK